MHSSTAASRWEELSGQRRGFIDRCELYAAYTLPKICPPEGYDQNTHELSHDFQSVGAQATNHIANKIMLALFSPTQPFFRADPEQATEAQMAEMGMDPSQIAEQLSKAEKDAVKQLDKLALRPKLYEVIKHLVITGNVLLFLDKESTRVMGLKKYVARRNAKGDLVEVIIGDRVRVDELDEDVREAIRTKNADTEVNHYRWIKRDRNGDYRMTQWVDAEMLPASKFAAKWPKDTMPYRVLTWDLSDGSDYGTGLVEDYRADFAGLSALTRSQVIGAVLASEFRWLVNPAGMTKAEDFEASENGSALAGQEGDITIIQSGKSADLQVSQSMSAEYVNRIGRGFLMGGSMVRNAERVTAEEIRLLANELETALGGAYSRLAVDIQYPMALWLMDMIGMTMNGSGFTPTIVTGLDALSRSGDLEDLKMLFMDLSVLNNVPEPVLAQLKLQAVIATFAAARRVQVSTMFKTQEELAAEIQQQRQQQIEDQAASGAVDAATQQAAQTQGQPE